MKNNLYDDQSPYLLQHKDNPVNWQKWSAESLELAKKEQKPILLSIGYASCHWCHVMAHESFEDKETSEIMNKYFINIKVDREERPDIDFVFQSSYQIFNQSSGGWPLTMFLDENAVPFTGGTYFPKDEKNGLPGFKNVLTKISKIYKDQREKIVNQAELINKSLELKKSSVLEQELEPILESVINNLDNKLGGYKGAPKFPTFNIFDTLLYFYNRTKNEKFLNPVKTILNQLCSQGIYDHAEGGIARYTVDENWLVPHFEKMLYDNAQFISLLSKLVNINSSEYFKNKIVQTISYFNKNFKVEKEKLLGTAFDADSEGEEGKYYVFDYNELKDIENINDYFDIQKEGNWEKKIILREKKYPPKKIIDKLMNLREKKIKPFFDNKIQLDLNCLWISALLSAHKILPKNGYLNQAEDLFTKLEERFLNQKIFHSNVRSIAFIEDYAYLINCLLDLYDQTFNQKYRLKAEAICKETIDHFYIKEKKIFQKNRINKNDLFFNPIDIADHTIPNGNSIMLINFARLGYVNEAKELSQSLNGYLNIYKSFMLSSIKSIDYSNLILSKENCGTDGCKI